jgi:hypothetical protein
MKVLLAPTEDFIKRDKTSLTADSVPGNGTVFAVENGGNYAVHDWIVIGYEGDATAELCQISAVGTTSLTVTTSLLTHKANEPIVQYRYNARKFYGATALAGAYTELTGYGSPVTIPVNDPQGTVLEYNGVEGYTYFKATYWNTYSSEESNVTDSDAVLADESVRYCSLYAIKTQAGLTNNPYITDGLVEVYRKRAENEVDSYLNARYVLPLLNSTGVAEIPFLVENCTTLLAAGYMDYKEFGKDGEGVKWLGEARSILKKLQTPGGQQLLGADKMEMQTKTLSSSVMSYPDTVDNDNGPVQVFGMRKRF